MNPPEGFEPIESASPFNQHIGPLWHRLDREQLVIGLRLERHHTNRAGNLHGGMVSTIADFTLGQNIGWTLSPEPGDPGARPSIATVSLTTEFIGTARIGDWVHTDTQIDAVKRTMVFATTRLLSGENIIARASAVFRRFG